MCHRADLVKYLGRAFRKEVLDLVQMLAGYLVKQAESEGLCTRRADRIEHGVSPADLDPACSALWLQPSPRFDKIGIRTCLCPFDLLRKCFVRIDHDGVLFLSHIRACSVSAKNLTRTPRLAAMASNSSV